MEKFDVAVIGAGMAGITAARDLSKKGLSVVVLEARDRVGGRTYLEKGLGDEIELGGAYVHWTQPHVWHELQKHGISLLPPLTATKAYWLADGSVHSGTEEEYYETLGPVMTQLFADARERFPLPYMINAVDNSDIECESIEDRIRSLGLSAYHRDVLDGALRVWSTSTRTTASRSYFTVSQRTSVTTRRSSRRPALGDGRWHQTPDRRYS